MKLATFFNQKIQYMRWISLFFLSVASLITLSIMIGCTSGLDSIINPPSVHLPEKTIEKTPEEKSWGQSVDVVAPADKISVEDKTANIVTEPVEQKRLNINEVIVQDKTGSRFLSNDSFVTRWNILGRFAYNPADFKKNGLGDVLHYEFIQDEKNLTGREPGGKDVNWQLVRFETEKYPGEIDIDRIYKNSGKNSAVYAVTYLHCNQPLNSLILYTGSAGYLKVWVNNKLVHAFNREIRAGKWDQDVVRGIKLQKGYNLVVVKCISVSNDWNFYFRLATEDDIPLKFMPL